MPFPKQTGRSPSPTQTRPHSGTCGPTGQGALRHHHDRTSPVGDSGHRPFRRRQPRGDRGQGGSGKRPRCGAAAPCRGWWEAGPVTRREERGRGHRTPALWGEVRGRAVVGEGWGASVTRPQSNPSETHDTPSPGLSRESRRPSQQQLLGVFPNDTTRGNRKGGPQA